MDRLPITLRRYDTGEVVRLELRAAGLAKALEDAFVVDGTGTLDFIVRAIHAAGMAHALFDIHRERKEG